MDRRLFLKDAALAAGAVVLSTGCTNGNVCKTKINEEKMPVRKSIMSGSLKMDAPLSEVCRAVKAAGFDGIEPGSHSGNHEELRDAMAEAGLVASSVCDDKHWKLLLSDPDPDIRKQGMDAAVEAMEAAKFFGTDAFLLVPGRVNENITYDECWERSTECIMKILPEAKRLGVKICIENVWNNFIMSPIEMKYYLSQFKSDYVRAYFDCGNVLVYGWPEQWIASLGDLVGRIHIKEFSNVIANEHGKRAGFDVPLAEGDVRWAEVMKMVRQHYNAGWLTTEQGSMKCQEDLNDLCSRLDRIIAM